MSEQNNISNNKRIAKNTLFLYIRMLLMLIISLYTSRVVLHELGVDDYGIYNVVGGIIVILSFLNNAMAGGTQRFLNFEMGHNDQDALKRVFSTSQHIHLILSGIILIVAETLGLWFLNYKMNIPINRISAANWVYQFSVASAIIGVISVPYNAVIIAHEKMSAFAYISILECVLKLVVAFLLILSPFDKLIFYATLIFIVGLINRVIYGVYSSKNFEECRHTSWHIDKPMMKQMLSFSGWTIVGNLGYILHTQGIALLINLFFTVSVNAAQGIANQVNSIVTQFTSNFLVALNPQVVKSYAAGEYEKMHTLIIRGCKMAFCMMSFFVIPLVLEAPTVLHIWLGIVPDYAVIFMRLVLLISLVNSFSSLLVAAKGATGDIKTYQITLTLIGALHIPFAWIAFSLGSGPEYSMYIYLVIVVILQIVRVLFVCNSVKLKVVDFIKYVFVRCTLVFLLSSIVPVILHIILAHSFLSTVIIGSFSVLGVVITTLYIALTHIERRAIFTFVLSKIKKNL